MTYRETLKWLSENWNGKFNTKSNAEIVNSQNRRFSLTRTDDFNVILQPHITFRLTRAEVEKRTGRKVIEWREPRDGERCWTVQAGYAMCSHGCKMGEGWILGDKLETKTCGSGCAEYNSLTQKYHCPFDEHIVSPDAVCRFPKSSHNHSKSIGDKVDAHLCPCDICTEIREVAASTPTPRRPLTVTDVMLHHNEVMALAIEVDGMKAENQACWTEDQLPVYREIHFNEKAAKVRELTKTILDRAKEEATQ